jgi:hypothetical protein
MSGGGGPRGGDAGPADGEPTNVYSLGCENDSKTLPVVADTKSYEVQIIVADSGEDVPTGAHGWSGYVIT